MIGTLQVTANGAGPKIVDIPPQKSVDLYFQFNLSGSVFVKIGAKPGDSPCADFWWIKWPLGTIEKLGRHCNFAQFKIPSVFDLSISSKLRVGAADNPIKVGVSDSSSVAHSISFDF